MSSDLPTPRATYRIRKFYRKAAAQKSYDVSVEVIDEETQAVLAACDLLGKPTLSTVIVIDSRQAAWQMAPNRKIMPSRWIVTDPAQQVAMQFNQKILGKLANPLGKVALTLLDANGDEVYRLVDPRGSILDPLFLNPDEWALMSGDRAVAKLVRLSSNTQPAKGLFGKLRSMLATSDDGFISNGRQHALPAPVALGMSILLKELTDTSVG